MVKIKKGIFLKNFLVGLLLIILICFGAGLGMFFSYVKDAPVFDPNKLKPSETSFVFDQNNEIIAELHGEQNRIPVSLNKVPEDLINAFIAIEDQYFYRHRGINIKSIIGAFLTDLRHGSYHRGASTITQQLVKNAFLSSEKTWKRKAQEAWISLQVERHYTKEEILEFYLNQIYFGHSSYGVEAAAQTYFGKSVSDLSLAESAILAGIPKGPRHYSPYLNYDKSKERQAIVLNRMVELGYISSSEAESAKKEELKLVGLQNAKADYKAPYFTDYVIQELADELQKEFVIDEDESFNKIYNGGLKIYTTVDMNIQEAAEKAMSDPKNYPYSKEDKNGVNQPQAAIAVIENQTGQIKALVGGREHQQKLGFNRASNAYRQPGSAFKPIVVYTGAVDLGYTAATLVNDAPVSYSSGSGKTWSPKNFTNSYSGLITIRRAIVRSVNVVAVKVLDNIGVDRGIEYAQKLGIKSLVLSGAKNDRNLPVALGGLTKGVTPLEMASAYSTLANQGVHIEPTAILKVEDKNGRILIDNQPDQWVAVNKQVAFIMTDMLKSVVTDAGGTGGRLAGLPFPVAGKTGTTNDSKDVWFVGYTPKYTAAVWMGHDNPKPMNNVAGGKQPALIWKQVIMAAHKNLPRMQFTRPDGIVSVSVCLASGKIPSELCYTDPKGPRIITEYFIKGTEPTSLCNAHVNSIKPSDEEKSPDETEDEAENDDTSEDETLDNDVSENGNNGLESQVPSEQESI